MVDYAEVERAFSPPSRRWCGKTSSRTAGPVGDGLTLLVDTDKAAGAILFTVDVRARPRPAADAGHPRGVCNREVGSEL